MRNTIILFLFFNIFSYPQSQNEVRKLLIKDYIHKYGDTIQFTNFDFLNDKIECFNLPFISSKLKSKIFFKTKFGFMDDLHSSIDDCIIMFDNQTKNIIVHLPMWYSGMQREFYKELFDIRLINKNEKKQFAKDIGAILTFYDKESKIKKIVIEKNIIVLTSTSFKDEYPNIINIFLKENKVVEIKRLSGKFQISANKIK